MRRLDSDRLVFLVSTVIPYRTVKGEPVASGAEEFAALARRLREAGQTGLRRELYKAVSDAVKPLGTEIRSTDHLIPYVPHRYAPVLGGDLSVTTTKRTGRDPGVTIRARGRVHRRKVVLLNEGVIQHPLFGDRKRWITQTRGMQPGFFNDPVNASAPRIKAAILAAMDDVARQIEKG